MDELEWTGKQRLESLTPAQICALIEEFLRKNEAVESATLVKLHSSAWSKQLANAIWVGLHLSAVSDDAVSPNGFRIS